MKLNLVAYIICLTTDIICGPDAVDSNRKTVIKLAKRLNLF